MSIENNSIIEPHDESVDAQLAWVRERIDEAEKSGFTSDSKADILKQSKSLIDE